MAKTIAILGGGNGACAMAADLALRGHRVRMYFRRRKFPRLFETHTMEVSGIVSGTARLEDVTEDLAAAVNGADYICLVAPAFSHAAYGEMLKGLLTPQQLLIVCPGAFASLEMRRCWGDVAVPLIMETNDLPYGTRIIGDGQVAIYNRNMVNVAFMPATAGQDRMEEMRQNLFPIGRLEKDILACGLSMRNPVTHPGSCLLNISNIERPDVDFFLYEHGFTPSAAKVSLALDRERAALAHALGYGDLQPIAEEKHLPTDYTWQQLYMSIHGDISHTVVRGPNDIQNRYLTEDVPYGLVPWAVLGQLAGIDMPVTNGIISIYNVIHDVDWRQSGLSADRLGIADMTLDGLTTYVRQGVK